MEHVLLLRDKIKGWFGSRGKICGNCSEARGIKNFQLIEGTEMSTMAEPTQWVMVSNKVVAY
jgi:sulfur relay (sulfurtransferase) complex TusBCD TusD component (DsrE family)